MTRFLIIGVSALLVPITPATVRAAGDSTFTDQDSPVLTKRCTACHGGAKPKGKLAPGTLTADFQAHGADWQRVADRLTDGTMPPRGKPRPSDTEVKTVIHWVAAGLTAAAAAHERLGLRRLVLAHRGIDEGVGHVPARG
jgi:cytochrome c5